MSSKVLSRADANSVPAIMWRKLDASPATFDAPQSGEDTAELRERLSKLQQRAEAEAAAAYQRGLRDGEAHAKPEIQRMQTETHAATERMAQSVRELAQIRPRLRQDAERDVVQLALAIARRVLRREVSMDPSVMQALAHIALQKLDRQEISRVYVHPNQAHAIKAALDGCGLRAEVIPEITREQGTLVFETNQGMLDASVNAQLEEIERGLTDRVNQS